MKMKRALAAFFSQSHALGSKDEVNRLFKK